MRVFVPFPDDFSELPELFRTKLVPYRPGVALAPEPSPPRAEANTSGEALPMQPPTARAA